MKTFDPFLVDSCIQWDQVSLSHTWLSRFSKNNLLKNFSFFKKKFQIYAWSGVETVLKLCLMPVSVALTHSIDNQEYGGDAEKREHAHASSGDISWRNPCGKQRGGSSKTKTRMIMWPCYTTHGHPGKRIKVSMFWKGLCIHAYSSSQQPRQSIRHSVCRQEKEWCSEFSPQSLRHEGT